MRGQEGATSDGGFNPFQIRPTCTVELTETHLGLQTLWRVSGAHEHAVTPTATAHTSPAGGDAPWPAPAPACRALLPALGTRTQGTGRVHRYCSAMARPRTVTPLTAGVLCPEVLSFLNSDAATHVQDGEQNPSVSATLSRRRGISVTDGTRNGT